MIHMAILHFASRNDPRLAPYRSLKCTSATRGTSRFVAEGNKLMRPLLASDFDVDSLHDQNLITAIFRLFSATGPARLGCGGREFPCHFGADKLS